MKKQTALEFLLNQVHEYGMIEFEKLFDIEIKEAKENEKSQIIQAYKDAFNNNEIDISFDVLNRISNYYWDEKYAK